MKIRILLSFFFLVGVFSFAQEKTTVQQQANIEAGNPFKAFGYTPKIATLSKGKYLEWHDLDSIVRIGSFLYHVKNKAVWDYAPLDDGNSTVLRPEVSSRWMSPDPLMEEFPDWSPYNFTLNNPLRFVDPEGLAPTDCPNCPQFNWDSFVSAMRGWFQGNFGGQHDAQQLAESGQHDAAQKIDAKIAQQTKDLQSYTDALSIVPGSSLPKAIQEIDEGDYAKAGLSLGIAALDLFGGGAAYKAKTSAKVVARGAPRYLYHYTSKEAAKSISQSGLRVGRDGFSYLTNTKSLSPLQAQIELALPVNRTLPTSILQINTSGLNPVAIRRVQGNLTGLGVGGGTEFLFNQHIPASAIKLIK